MIEAAVVTGETIHAKITENEFMAAFDAYTPKIYEKVEDTLKSPDNSVFAWFASPKKQLDLGLALSGPTPLEYDKFVVFRHI